MKESLELKLMQEFPFMQARHVWTGTKLDFPVPIEFGDGWFDLVYEMCQKIKTEYDKMSKGNQEAFYVIQAKEKFAELRFYTTFVTDEIDKAIIEAEKKSVETCEVCGADAEIKVKNMWYRTLCNKCKDEQGYRDIKKEDEDSI